MTNERESNKDSRGHFVAGIAAGVAEWLIGHPLDTIRIRMISGTTKTGTYKQLATGFSSVKGIENLYRGSLSELYAAALGGSLLFGVNNVLKIFLNVSHVQGASDRPVSSGLLLAAAGTGFFDALVYKPLEGIKLRMQVELCEKPLNFSQCARKIIRDGGGIAGLYHGLLPTLFRESIGSAAFFAAYEMTKVSLNRALGRPSSEVDTSIVLISGGVAGAAYVLTSQPFETTAILMQLDSTCNPKYKGMLDCMMSIFRRGGVKGLYRGFTPTMLRALPSYSAAFFGYEYALIGYENFQGNH